jgi:hypothetical protein
MSSSRSVERFVPAGAPARTVSFDELYRQAKVLAETELVPKALQGNAEAIVLVGTYGAELGIPLTTSLQQIDVIEGKPSPSAQLRVALIRRAGHEIRWGETSDQRAVIFGRRREYRGDPAGWVRVEWTIDQARRAGLLDLWVEKWKNEAGQGAKPKWKLEARLTIKRGDDGGFVTADLGEPLPEWARQQVRDGRIKSKDNWQKWTPDMLRARAATTLSRMEFSDVLAALGMPEDDHDSPFDAGDGLTDWPADPTSEPEGGDSDREPGEERPEELVACSEGVIGCDLDGPHQHDTFIADRSSSAAPDQAPGGEAESGAADPVGETIATPQEPPAAEEGSEPSELPRSPEESLRGMLADLGVNIGVALKTARDICQSRSRDLPSSIDEVARDTELAAEVIRRVS